MIHEGIALLQANFPAVEFEPGVVQRLAALLPLRALPTGRSLFLQGQTPGAFYGVLEGEIETRFNGLDGRSSLIDPVGPLRLFGLAAFAAQHPSEYEAVARLPTRLLVIGPEAYALLMDEVPGFARALMAEFAHRFDRTMALLQSARHQTAAERLQSALTRLARERGRTAGERGWLELRATQAELAEMAHLSRQTVNELLRARAAAGQLRLGRGWVALPAPP